MKYPVHQSDGCSLQHSHVEQLLKIQMVCFPPTRHIWIWKERKKTLPIHWQYIEKNDVQKVIQNGGICHEKLFEILCLLMNWYDRK